MDSKPASSDLRDIVRQSALLHASTLSSVQAREVWRAMRSLILNRAPDNMPGALIRAATMFNRYPECRKLIGEKAQSIAGAARWLDFDWHSKTDKLPLIHADE
jgi:hypothetical protein